VLKIVVHYLDGSLVKGTTTDFTQNRQEFHVTDRTLGRVKTVNTTELKAIFFVKSFEGSQQHIERSDVERSGFGRKIKVLFKDGETLFGYTTSYSPGRAAFFVYPADPESNNERVLVLEHSTDSINFV